MFSFITPQKTYTLERIDNKDQEVREASWNALLEDPDYSFPYQLLKTTEDQIRDRVLGAQGALLMPEMAKAAPGSMLDVHINLIGKLSVKTIKCRLFVSGTATVQSVHSNQLLRDSGFVLADITEPGGSEIFFSIKHNTGINTLPEGTIIVARLGLGPTSPVKYILNLDTLETEPAGRTVRPVNNVVLVLSS